MDDRSPLVRRLSLAVVVLAQSAGGALVGFILGFGSGLVVVMAPVGMVLGVWGVGLLAPSTGGFPQRRRPAVRLVSTALGAGVGAGAAALLPQADLAVPLFLVPLLGALVGFHLGPGARAESRTSQPPSEPLGPPPPLTRPTPSAPRYEQNVVAITAVLTLPVLLALFTVAGTPQSLWSLVSGYAIPVLLLVAIVMGAVAKQKRPRSIWMGVLIGYGAASIIGVGVCSAVFSVRAGF